jgi:spore germination protein PE
MLQRTACVDCIKIDGLSFSSILQIGDSEEICGFSRAIAVQREAEVFIGTEGSFAAYPLFTDPIPLLPIDEVVSTSTGNLNPIIKVGNIKILGVSSSSVIHLGNSRHITMEVRVKHIRQLLPKDEQKQ